MKAVRFDRYGDASVLEVRAVDRPDPAACEVLVEVFTAGINPGEIAIREGRLKDIAPADFPEGQGSDFAGRVAGVGHSAYFALRNDARTRVTKISIFATGG